MCECGGGRVISIKKKKGGGKEERGGEKGFAPPPRRLQKKSHKSLSSRKTRKLRGEPTEELNRGRGIQKKKDECSQSIAQKGTRTLERGRRIAACPDRRVLKAKKTFQVGSDS